MVVFTIKPICMYDKEEALVFRESIVKGAVREFNHHILNNRFDLKAAKKCWK
jgi:hypothetical protein